MKRLRVLVAAVVIGVPSAVAPDNLELMVKVLDGCLLNQRFWVFAAGPDIIVDPVPPAPRLCARLDGEAVHYYFNDGPMVWHAVSPAPGQVPTVVEDFNLMLPTIPPPWADDLAECRRTYHRS